MAKEWYLLSKPNQLSGFESDSLVDFAAEGFLEILDSDMASDIELYNYDMSERTDMRAVVQNNVQDTKLKTLSRMLLVPIGSCKAGMYVKYHDRYWLIVGLVDNNSMYEKAIMTICNYKLAWLNNTNILIERWVNVSSASQYNNGENNGEYFTIRNDQVFVIMPDDDESISLNPGQRFIIDKRCKVYEKNFTDNVTCDTSKLVSVYKLTRSDSVLFDYQDSGVFQFLASQVEQADTDGYYKINGTGYWLCSSPKSDDETIVLSCNIDYESNEIYNGLEPEVFTAKFYDSNGNEMDETPVWHINCDFENALEVEYVDKAILISVNNKKLVNKSFELSLSCDGYKTVTIPIYIKAFI